MMRYVRMRGTDSCKEAAAPYREYVTEGRAEASARAGPNGPIIYSRLSFLGPLPARPKKNCSVQVRRRENRPFSYRSKRKRWESSRPGGPWLDWVSLHQVSCDHLWWQKQRVCGRRVLLSTEARQIEGFFGRSRQAKQSKASEQIRWTNHCRKTPHTAHVGREGGLLRGLLKLKMNKTPACRHLRPRCPDCDECWLGNLDFRPMCLGVCVCVWLQPTVFFVSLLGVWSDDLFDVRPLAPQSDMLCPPGCRGPGGRRERSPIPLTSSPGIGRAFRQGKTVDCSLTCTRYTHTHTHGQAHTPGSSQRRGSHRIAKAWVAAVQVPNHTQAGTVKRRPAPGTCKPPTTALENRSHYHNGIRVIMAW